MYGLGVLKGMGVTLKHFVETYIEDLKYLGKGKRSVEAFTVRQGLRGKSLGLFTVEYPEEKIAVPERFRFVPFLVINNLDDPYYSKRFVKAVRLKGKEKEQAKTGNGSV
jgi:NADH-quinone oxidoreductase subunit I